MYCSECETARLIAIALQVASQHLGCLAVSSMCQVCVQAADTKSGIRNGLAWRVVQQVRCAVITHNRTCHNLTVLKL